MFSLSRIIDEATFGPPDPSTVRLFLAQEPWLVSADKWFEASTCRPLGGLDGRNATSTAYIVSLSSFYSGYSFYRDRCFHLLVESGMQFLKAPLTCHSSKFFISFG